jgi:hypothetical protein
MTCIESVLSGTRLFGDCMPPHRLAARRLALDPTTEAGIGTAERPIPGACRVCAIAEQRAIGSQQGVVLACPFILLTMA